MYIRAIQWSTVHRGAGGNATEVVFSLRVCDSSALRPMVSKREPAVMELEAEERVHFLYALGRHGSWRPSSLKEMMPSFPAKGETLQTPRI